MKIKLQMRTVKDRVLPDQLVIVAGKLMCTDGTEPDFSLMPNGQYTLMPRYAAQNVVNLAADAKINAADADLARGWGA